LLLLLLLLLLSIFVVLATHSTHLLMIIVFVNFEQQPSTVTQQGRRRILFTGGLSRFVNLTNSKLFVQF